MKSCIIALFTFSKWSFSGLSVSHYPILSVLFCNKNFESHLTPIKNSWLKQYNWVINFQYVSVPITLRYIRLPTYMWKVWKRVENIQNKRNYNSFFSIFSTSPWKSRTTFENRHRNLGNLSLKLHGEMLKEGCLDPLAINRIAFDKKCSVTLPWGILY